MKKRRTKTSGGMLSRPGHALEKGRKSQAGREVPVGTRMAPRRPVIFTIGHSTRNLETFLGLLQAHGVKKVVDVRTIPRSRHNPQFNRETLPGELRSVHIGYKHLAGLGGLRHPRADSPNQAWRNASFRGFADYMQTPEFKESLKALIELGRKEPVAIMCAEAVPWRCHRSLIADALLVRGLHVEHIMSGIRCQSHQLTPWAKVKGTRVTYPAGGQGSVVRNQGSEAYPSSKRQRGLRERPN
jgi:hypothetical protein